MDITPRHFGGSDDDSMQEQLLIFNEQTGPRALQSDKERERMCYRCVISQIHLTRSLKNSSKLRDYGISHDAWHKSVGTGILSQLMAKATGALPEVIQALIELDRART